MKKHTLLLCLTLISISSVAQKTTGFRLYQNSDMFDVRYTDYAPNPTTTERRINFTRFSIAAQLSSKQFTHEIEFFIPEFSKELNRVQFPFDHEFLNRSETEKSFSSFALRYEYRKQFNDSRGPFLFFVGAGINPTYTITKYDPIVSNFFTRTDKIFCVSLNLIPRIAYQFTTRFSADLSIPLKIYDFQYFHRYVENPNIPIAQQKDSNTIHVFFEDVYTVRVGLIYSFASK